VCCSLPAAKPRCGTKMTVNSPDSKKSVEVSTGLGKWRCSGCGKPCKVTVKKHAAADAVAPSTTVGEHA
jgi:hypothetical protein